jgi:hypothetical protein
LGYFTRVTDEEWTMDKYRRRSSSMLWVFFGVTKVLC